MIETIRFEPVAVQDVWADLPANELRRHLSEEEEAVYRSLSTPKRRRDWLGGRIAAKRLLSAELGRLGNSYTEDRVRIFNLPSGQPDWSVEGAAPRWPISISHTSTVAGCALNTHGAAIGMDLERVEERDPAWLEIALHPTELTPEVRKDPVLQTRFWTVKEAVLKLLGLGLRADLWEVRCRAADGTGAIETKLFGLTQHQYREIGTPEIFLSTWSLADSVVTVAYTLERVPQNTGGLNGSLA